MKRLLWGLLVAVLCGVPQLAMAQSGLIGAPRLPKQSALAPNGLTMSWWGQAKLNPARDRVVSVTNDEFAVYVYGSNGIVTAFDAESGTLLWAVAVGLPEANTVPVSSGFFANGKPVVLAASGMHLIGLERSTGTQMFSLRLPGFLSAPVTVHNGRMFTAVSDGSVYAFDLDKVVELHGRGVLNDYGFEAVQWRLQCGGQVKQPILPAGPFVGIVSQDNQLQSITAADRQLKFQLETDGVASSKLTRYKNYYILPAEDYNVYSVNVETGRVKWTYAAGQRVHAAPVVVGNDLFLAPDSLGLYRLTADGGQEVWIRRGVSSIVAVSPTKVYGVNKNSTILITDRKTGADLGSVSLPQFNVLDTNSRTDRIFVTSKGGVIVCLREIDSRFPVLHEFPDQLNILPTFAPDSKADGEGMQALPAADSDSSDSDSANSDSSTSDSSDSDETSTDE